MMDEIKVTQKAADLGNSVEAVMKEIKRVASVKCRVNKMPGRADYQLKMDLIAEEEELLKAVRDYLKGPQKNVNNLTEERIACMDYIDVVKAIRSIQSKKTHTKYADDCLKDEEGLFIPGSGESYKEACRIEDLLKARRDEIKPLAEKFSRSALMELLDELDVDFEMDFEAKYEAVCRFVRGEENE